MQKAQQNWLATSTRIVSSPWAFGTTVTLQPFLRTTAYQNIQAQAHFLEYSAGTEAHEPAYQDIMAAAFQLLQPLLVGTGVTTQEEVYQLY